MVLHLIKLSVGAESVEHFARFTRARVKTNEAAGFGAVGSHVTRMFPRRAAEIAAGGSVYWVIKGVVLVRQKVLDFTERLGEDGVRRCAIMLDPTVVPTEAQPRRPFQGWRYLRTDDAPPDLSGRALKASPDLRARLAELGLL